MITAGQPNYFGRAQKWKNVNAAAVQSLVNVNAAVNNLKGVTWFRQRRTRRSSAGR